jgi:hypothetical protein
MDVTYKNVTWNFTSVNVSPNGKIAIFFGDSKVKVRGPTLTINFELPAGFVSNEGTNSYCDFALQ